MLKPLEELADNFRFLGWEALSDDERDRICEWSRQIADLLPRHQGELLFELLEFEVPSDYVGLPNPRNDEAWKARLEWPKRRRNEEQT